MLLDDRMERQIVRIDGRIDGGAIMAEEWTNRLIHRAKIFRNKGKLELC